MGGEEQLAFQAVQARVLEVLARRSSHGEAGFDRPEGFSILGRRAPTIR